MDKMGENLNVQIKAALKINGFQPEAENFEKACRSDVRN